jgi:hypothetical protein
MHTRLDYFPAVTNRLFIALALAGLACGGASPPPAATSEAPAPEPVHPLAAFASTRIINVPAQRIVPGGAAGWAEKLQGSRAWLDSLDAAFERELRARRASSNWAFAADLARSSRRNPTFAADPYTIRASDAVRQLERRKDAVIAEPVASQLRALTGLHDARYAFVVSEVRFEPVAGSSPPSARAVAHAAVLDVRGSSLSWARDVSSDAFAEPSSSLLASLASRLADLFVPR